MTICCLFGWLVRPRQALGYIADGSQDWPLTIFRAATQETERGDHDIFFSRSHYPDDFGLTE